MTVLYQHCLFWTNWRQVLGSSSQCTLFSVNQTGDSPYPTFVTLLWVADSIHIPHPCALQPVGPFLLFVFTFAHPRNPSDFPNSVNHLSLRYQNADRNASYRCFLVSHPWMNRIIWRLRCKHLLDSSAIMATQLGLRKGKTWVEKHFLFL